MPRIYPRLIFFWLALLSVAVLLASVLFRGVLVGPDSLTYLRSAEVFFTANHAQTSVQFPPLYSILLKSLMALNLSELQSALLLNFLFFSSSVGVCSYLLYNTHAAGRKKAILLSLVLMSSYVVFITHQQMMTESLFILLVFINIALLERYARTPTYWLVILASLVASLSALTRYAGIAIILSTLSILLIYARERSIKSWFKIALLWGLSSILFGLWLLRNNILYATFTGREVSSHDRQFESFGHYLDTLSQLYFPQMLPEKLRTLLFAVFVVLTLFMLLRVYVNDIERDRDDSIRPVRSLVSIITVVFVFQVMLMIIALYVDSFLPVQRRILTPIYASLLLLHFLLLAYFCRKPNRRIWLFVYAGLYLLLNASRLTVSELKSDKYRYGYASDVYTKSTLIDYMQSVESTAVITSNGDDVIAWHLDRAVAALPKLVDPRTNRPNPAFNKQMNALYCQLKLSDGYLVFFHNITWRDYLPSLDSIRRQYPFRKLQTFPDGIVFTADNNDNKASCVNAS